MSETYYDDEGIERCDECTDAVEDCNCTCDGCGDTLSECACES